MPSNPPARTACSRCGSTEVFARRFVACGSQTFFEYKEKDVVIPTTSELLGRISSNWKNGPLQIWEIGMCKACLGKDSERRLVRRIGNSRIVLACAGCIFAGAVISAAVLHAYGRELHDLLLLTFCVSTLGALVAGLVWLVSSRWLRQLRRSGHIAARVLDEAFSEEAKRILTTLEGGTPNAVWGHFPLPAFKEVDDLPEGEKKHLLAEYEPTSRRRILVSVADNPIVAETAEKLRKALPREWKRALETQ